MAIREYLKTVMQGVKTYVDNGLAGKADSSHGTHVTWSTTTPKANGTASVGSETKVARGDHIHPTDTTRAAASDLTSHTGNKSNPHGVTKAQVGLGNVENKSSATIRGELTKANVTTALGYTPPTTNTTYNDATTSQSGLMSATDKSKLDAIDLDNLGGVTSWNDLTDKPFGEIGQAEDLAWDGNITGLEVVNGQLYKVANITPTYDDLRNGFSVTLNDGYVFNYNTSNLNYVSPFIKCANDFFWVVLEDTTYNGSALTKGTYFMQSGGTYTALLTINDYEIPQNTEIKTLDMKFIPEEVATKEYIETSYQTKTDSTLSTTDKSIVGAINEVRSLANSGVTGVKGSSESSYRTGKVNITKANIGLGNVNNTADTAKPVSTAQQAAIDSALASAKSYTDTVAAEHTHVITDITATEEEALEVLMDVGAIEPAGTEDGKIYIDTDGSVLIL